MKANSDKSKQSNKATRRVLAGVLCGASVLSLVLSLVMPPISQAIANDAQTEETVTGDSSTEPTDVENTNNGDTEKQNSDEIEGDETGSSNSDEQAQAEEQLDDELQVEDGDSPNDGAVMAAAEGEQAETASGEISNATELKTKLTDANGAVSFKLVGDIDTSETITLNKDGSKITLDLNGYKIKHTSQNQPLFNITGGATLTVKDGQKVAATETTATQTNKNGNLASMEYEDASGIPNGLTYYVTESSPNGTGTTETLKAYKANIAGAIVACGGADANGLKLVNLFNGGHFNLESGALTQKKGDHVSNLIYAENGSTVNISGGYVCGASTGTGGTGAGVMVSSKWSASTLNLTGNGVVAGNYALNGGGVCANGSTINMSGGTIAGNGTFVTQSGYGAGIYALNSTVDISNGYITNNRYQYYADNEGSTKHLGNGCHGGGGIAAFNGGSLKINGGYITGNYSAEAGGGIYAGAWNQALSSFTFSGGTIASNVAQNSEGGGIRIAAPTVGVFEVANGSHAYITNNTTNTTNDWGGGGVFVQGGNSDENVNSATLKIYNALITNNSAEGYGGGFAACPTGKTAITDTNGIAIFGNRDENGAHLSGGTNGKNEDQPTTVEGGEITDTFKQNGHKDLFLIRKSDNSDYIAAVTGQMLGGGAANWKGTIDGQPPTTIGKYEGAQAKYMIGLDADPSDGDQGLARDNATLFITGNKSNIHGGGIMTNGDVVAGSTQEVKVYPRWKLNGTKVLTGRELKNEEFEFMLLKQGADKKAPSFGGDGTLQLNGCSVVNTVKNDENGNFSFDLGEVYADDDLVYYLVEVPGADKDVTYDKAIYKIDPKVEKDEIKSHKVLDIEYTYYTVSSVAITTIAANGTTSVATVYPAPEGDVASVALTKSKTFTNAYTKYDSNGSWTPKATKVVEGGEMKEFTLQLAKDSSFKNGDIVGTAVTSVTSGDNTKQTLSFSDASGKVIELKYSLSDITANPDTAGDSMGHGASKTFYYYVREKDDSSTYPHYKFDPSVYRFKVVAKDDTEGHIDCAVTYRKGTVDSDGKWKDAENADHELTDDSTPTFTNTYSTSLPLSGMSGVTLAYLAGAAVLCAAAAWMHIRRKANAKGGERRE